MDKDERNMLRAADYYCAVIDHQKTLLREANDQLRSFAGGCVDAWAEELYPLIRRIDEALGKPWPPGDTPYTKDPANR